MNMPPFSIDKIGEQLRHIPRTAGLLDGIMRETGLGAVIFGGTIRDLIFFGSPGGDLDIITFGGKRDGYKGAIERVAGSIGAKIVDYPGSHIVVDPPNSPVTFDVHYPKDSLLEGLVRSDFTVNGIGFNWGEQKLEDPFGGVEDLKSKRLRMHSPQYVVTNPPNFPRMFRTAAKLGFPIEGETEAILKRFAGMINLHEGKTNIRVLFELLKFLSLPAIGSYLMQFHKLGLIEGIFPELAVTNMTPFKADMSLLDRNVTCAAALDLAKFGGKLEAFVKQELGFGITNLGIIRMMALFVDLGRSYYEYNSDAPYIKAVASGDKQIFTRRINHTLMMHIASRFRDAKELAEMLAEMPLVLEYLGQTAAADQPIPQPPDALSPAAKVRAQILNATLGTVGS